MMTVASGTVLGHYTILAPLGAGGMGEVWLAEDMALKRQVALKLLPDAVALDTYRPERFNREAQALAALHHSHITQVHGLVREGGVRAIVMELVEGRTLAERVTRCLLPIVQALPLAIQLADALEYAHDHGIVRRDLKPATGALRMPADRLGPDTCEGSL